MVKEYEALLDCFTAVTTDAGEPIDHTSLTFQRERAFVQNSLAGVLEERGESGDYDRAYALYILLCQERSGQEKDTRNYGIQYHKNLGKFLLDIRKDPMGARPHLQIAYDSCCEDDGPEVHLKLTQIPILSMNP